LDDWLERKEAARSHAVSDMFARGDSVTGGSHDGE
jgi:hypothetical protein